MTTSLSLSPISTSFKATSIQSQPAPRSSTIARLQPRDSVRFGSYVAYNGFFNGVNLITDFRGATSNGEAESYFKDALTFFQTRKQQLPDIPKPSLTQRLFSVVAGKTPVSGSGILPVRSICDIPEGNIEKAAFDILRFALRPNREIHVIVVDPGVGNGQDRSILVTKNHGILIGPNNGIFSLLHQTLKEDPAEDVRILPIDLERIQQLERIRLNRPGYTIPKTFHGRDVFVVVAAGIAAGLPPEYFAKRVGKEDFTVLPTPFSKAVSPLPSRVGETVPFLALRDDTRGNLKTSLFLTEAQEEALRNGEATYQIIDPAGKQAQPPVPLKQYFSQVKPGEPLLYLGSTYNRFLESRFLELALNGGNISDTLQVEATQSKPFLIQRIS